MKVYHITYPLIPRIPRENKAGRQKRWKSAWATIQNDNHINDSIIVYMLPLFFHTKFCVCAGFLVLHTKCLSIYMPNKCSYLWHHNHFFLPHHILSLSMQSTTATAVLTKRCHIIDAYGNLSIQIFALIFLWFLSEICSVCSKQWYSTDSWNGICQKYWVMKVKYLRQTHRHSFEAIKWRERKKRGGWFETALEHLIRCRRQDFREYSSPNRCKCDEITENEDYQWEVPIENRQHFHTHTDTKMMSNFSDCCEHFSAFFII